MPSYPISSAPPAVGHGKVLDEEPDLNQEEEQQQHDDHEMTEEERMEIAKRCLRCTDVTLMIIGAALAGVSLYVSSLLYDNISSALMYAAAGIGGALFAITAMGLFAVCTKNTRINVLLVYFTFLVFLAFAALVLGGFCFILTDSAVAYITTQWQSILASLPPSQRSSPSLSSAEHTIRTACYAIGATALLVAMLCTTALNSAVALITPSRAYTVFLQATNISLLPIGVALIAAAVYVADTAVATEAAAAAFAIFILGAFVIVLLLLGCVGTSLQSRGIVRLFMILTFLLSATFLAFGILSLVQSSLVSDFITSKWSLIRRVLPPDFSGRYDKEVFARYINANLTALGFLSVCAGVVLFAQTFASYRLRAELKFESELEQEAWDAVKNKLLPAEVAETIATSQSKSKARILWKQHWTKGSKVSRRVILCGCGTLCAFVLIAVSLASLALYYSTTCTSLSGFKETRIYNEMTVGPFAYLQNNYSLGTVGATLDTSRTTTLISVSYTKAALKSGMAVGSWPSITNRTVTVHPDEPDHLGSGVGTNVTMRGLETDDTAPTTILGYDISCQNNDVMLTVPRAQVWSMGTGNSRLAGDAFPLAFQFHSQSGSAGVEVDWSASQYVDRPRVRSLVAHTLAGTINIDGVPTGSVGLQASSTLGEIAISEVEARCDPALLGTGRGGVVVSSLKGSVNIDAMDSKDCDVYLSVAEAMLLVTRSRIENSLGGGTVSMIGTRGIMELSHSSVQVVDMKGDEGSIRVTNCTVAEAVKVSTRAGGVAITQAIMAPRAIIQVETDSGEISIWAKKFRGIISVVTGGSVQCITSTNDGFDDADPCALTAGSAADSSGDRRLKVVEGVSVNCKTSTRNDCPYLGHITITSTTGDVILRMDKV